MIDILLFSDIYDIVISFLNGSICIYFIGDLLLRSTLFM